MPKRPYKEGDMRRRKDSAGEKSGKSDPPKKLTRAERRKQKEPPRTRGGAAAARRQAKPMDPRTARNMASGLGSTMDYDPNKRDVTSWEDMQGKPERAQYDTPPKAQDFIDKAREERRAARKAKWGKTRKEAAQERRAAQKEQRKRRKR